MSYIWTFVKSYLVTTIVIWTVIIALGATLANAHSSSTDRHGCHSGSQPFHCHNANKSKVTLNITVGNQTNRYNHNVLLAQQFLNTKGYRLSTDGIWGRNTNNAVVNYFAQHNQVFDGRFDRRDLNAMYSMRNIVINQPTSNGNVSIQVISTTRATSTTPVIVDNTNAYQFLFETNLGPASKQMKTCQLLRDRRVSSSDRDVLLTYARVKNICNQ